MADQKIHAIASSAGHKATPAAAAPAAPAAPAPVKSEAPAQVKSQKAAADTPKTDQDKEKGAKAAPAVDSSGLTDELSEELQEEKQAQDAKDAEKQADRTKTEAELREEEIKALEKEVDAKKKQIEEDLKSGDLASYQTHLGELQGMEKQLEGLQAQAQSSGQSQSQPQTQAPASSAPAASGAPAYAAPAAAPGSYRSAPSAAPAAAGSAPRTANVVNDSTPVAGRPNGLNQIISTFGQPGTNQVTTKMPAGPGGKMIDVTCNAKIADKMKGAFEEIKARGLSDQIHSFDGCFVNRDKRGGSGKSTHAWGIAFDVNASENPQGSTWQTEGQRQLAQVFEKYGFHQIPNDPMHFQYATGY